MLIHAARQSARFRPLRRRLGAAMLLRYSVRFALAKFAMPGLARLVPPRLYAYLPSGAMESTVRLDTSA